MERIDSQIDDQELAQRSQRKSRRSPRSKIFDAQLFDELAPRSVSGSQFVSRMFQGIEGRSRPLFLDQHVIGVISRNGEDGNAFR